VHKKLSVKAQLRKIWEGNHSRLYKDIRGTGEVLYGAATRDGLIHTKSINEENQRKDSKIIGIRQNLLTYLRLNFLLGLLDCRVNTDMLHLI
jgi:GH24 family phage-related lysozyme (muramidase)